MFTTPIIRYLTATLYKRSLMDVEHKNALFRYDLRINIIIYCVTTLALIVYLGS